MPPTASGPWTTFAARHILPPLESSAAIYKGVHGRIGVVGGSSAYSGAPYYAAYSALRSGVDLVYVFCAHQAATVIKSYSPELIVYPVADDSDSFNSCRLKVAGSGGLTESPLPDSIQSIVERLHVLVVGPGLSRSPVMVSTAHQFLKCARKFNVPVIVDADGLHIIAEYPDLVRGYRNAILTPNANEFFTLWNSKSLHSGNTSAGTIISPEIQGFPSVERVMSDLQHVQSATKLLANSLGGVTVFRKGIVDVVSNGTYVTSFTGDEFIGSPRRCGGQGDVLAGMLAAWASWWRTSSVSTSDTQSGNSVPVHDIESFLCHDSVTGAPVSYVDAGIMCSTLPAALTMRRTAASAFTAEGRSMSATHLLSHIGKTFGSLWDSHDTKSSV